MRKLQFISILALFSLAIVSNIYASDIEEFISQKNIISNKVFNPLIEELKKDREEFYIFGVGQGNSQLAIYEKSAFAVLYDCGSSSSQIHPKIKDLQNYNNFKTIFRKIDKTNKIHKKEVEKGLENIDLFDEEKIEENKIRKKSQESEESLASNKISTAYHEINSFIKDTIENYRLRHLFIFLSHPDEDHINLINDKLIPSNLSVTAFLGGDWLGDGGSNKEKTNFSSDVNKVLSFLFQRKDTWVELPYYWDYKGRSKSSEIKDYPDLMCNLSEKINSLDTEKIYQTFKKSSFLQNDPAFFQGDLYDLILFLKGRKNLNLEKFNSHFKNVIPTYLNYYDENDLKRVNILLMNHQFDDVNSQSTILSFKMPELKMHFICTGDAHDETFKHPFLYENRMKEDLNLLKLDYLNVLILPHHGSFKNLSGNMLRLFQPDLLVVSAGNGKQHGHPRKKTIKAYAEAFEQELIQNRFFKDHYLSGPENTYLSFKGKGEEASIACIHINPQHPPIICTNILGTLKIDEEGVKSVFSNVISTKEGKNYKVLFHRREELTKETLSTIKINEISKMEIPSLAIESKLYFMVFKEILNKEVNDLKINPLSLEKITILEKTEEGDKDRYFSLQMNSKDKAKPHEILFYEMQEIH